MLTNININISFFGPTVFNYRYQGVFSFCFLPMNAIMNKQLTF